MRQLTPLIVLLLGFPSLSVPGLAFGQQPLPGSVQPGAIIRYTSRHHPVHAQHGMVVSQNELASRAGIEILEQGGNAIDAAVTVATVLAVTLPRAGNLGGGGFMLVHQAESKQTLAYDFRSTAPAEAEIQRFINADGSIDRAALRNQASAAATPGTVAGLYQAHRRFGHNDWAALLQPAIQLAENGIPVSHDLANVLRTVRKQLAVSPAATNTFYPAGNVLNPGQQLIQKDLAWSLRQIAAHGAQAFYRGAVAQRMHADLADNGGLIQLSDLAAYQVREVTPLATDYRGYQVLTMPPPSAGVIILEMLEMLECFELKDYPAGSARQIHLLTEVLKRSYRDRIQYIEDPAFIAVPDQGLIDPAYIQRQCKRISTRRATPTKRLRKIDPWQFDSRDTTHFSIVDKSGNAISLTYTLGSSFGSGYMPAGTGILLNNQMRNFLKPGTQDLPAEQRFRPIKAGKRMISTMSPVMALEDGKLLLVTGSPGGHRIPAVNLQILLNVLDYGFDIATATQLPRVHHNYVDDVLRYEQGVSPDTLSILQKMGHRLRLEPSMGSTQSIYRGATLQGAADQRRPQAKAIGY